MSKFRGKRAPDESPITGLHAVDALLTHNPKRARILYIDNKHEQLDSLVARAKSLGVTTRIVDRQAMEHVSGNEPIHQGVLLQCGPFTYVDEYDALDNLPKLILVLDGVEDPRNLGRAARSAWSMGAGLLVIPQDRAAQVTPIVEKTAVGALAQLPVMRVVNLRRTLQQLQERDILIVGVTHDAPQPIWKTDLNFPTALVIGGEDRGLRRLTRESCDHLVTIPMAQGRLDEHMSLNAADAATIALYEVTRQRAPNRK